MEKCVAALNVVFIFSFCSNSQAGKRYHRCHSGRTLAVIYLNGIRYNCDA